MSYLYSLVFLVTSYSMPVLLAVLGIAGNPEQAAEIGIIHGASLALLFAFSANARSLILNPAGSVSAQTLLAFRLALVIPLTLCAYLVGMASIKMEPLFALALLLRRCVEWLGEIHLSEMERRHDVRFARVYLVLQLSLLSAVLVAMVTDSTLELPVLFAWGLAPLILSLGYIWKTLGSFFNELRALPIRTLLPHVGSTAITGVSVFLYRQLILMYCGKELAGDFFTAFTLGGMVGNLFANILGPAYVLHEHRSGVRRFPALIRLAAYGSVAVGLALAVSAYFSAQNWMGKSRVFWMATGLSMVGGGLMIYGNRLRLRLLQHDEVRHTLIPDVCMNFCVVASVPVLFYLAGTPGISWVYPSSAVTSWLIFRVASRTR